MLCRIADDLVAESVIPGRGAGCLIIPWAIDFGFISAEVLTLPILVHLECIKQWSALYGGAAAIPTTSCYWHGEMKGEYVVVVPCAIDDRYPTRGGIDRKCIAIYGEDGVLAPCGNAQMEGECGFLCLLVFETKGEPDVFGEGIAGRLGDGKRHIVCHHCLYGGWAIDQCGKTMIGCGIPQVLHKFGPPLMHVTGAARISVQGAEKDIGVVVRCAELAPCLGDGDLVGLLIILTRHEMVVVLCGECVICNSFKVIGPLYVASNLKHSFKREHHFGCCAELRAHGGFAKTEELVASP